MRPTIMFFTNSTTDFTQSRRVRCALFIFAAPLALVCGVIWREAATVYVWKPAMHLIADVREAAKIHPCVQPRASYFDNGTNLEDEVAAIVRESTDRHVLMGVRVENWGTRKIYVNAGDTVMNRVESGVVVAFLVCGWLAFFYSCCAHESTKLDLNNAIFRNIDLERDLAEARNAVVTRGSVETTD